MGENISLKYVNEFIDETKEKVEFAVPDYQRGYKWTTENINELLNDIITLKDGEEYCLMPIITRRDINAENPQIEIVDGQQRLTTLRLIINHIFNDDSKCRYSIPQECYNNLDKANIDNAITAIESFEKKDVLREKLFPSAAEKQSPFYFIWYEIEGEEIDAINTFNRINSWKIPLKESELAKAYIFSAFGPESYAERRIANIKWANLEKLVNNADFFSFFTIGKTKDQLNEYESAHMDLLLEILSAVRLELPSDKREGYRYPIYKAIVKKSWDGAKLLAELERIANVMKFIFEDKVSYHLASYFLLKKKDSATQKTVSEIVKLYMNNDSYPSAKVLLDEIKKESFLATADGKAIVNREYVEKLNYWETKDKPVLNDILTLYNICDALKNNALYDFYPTVLHGKQNWTLEHIHAKNERPKKEEEIKSIIELLYSRFSSENEKKWLNEQKVVFKDGIDSFYDKILYPLLSGVSIDAIRPDINSDDIDDPWYETSIMNLALLPDKENSTFNNSTYLEKIEKLKSFDLSCYIPKCTLQCFSRNFFSESDVYDVWTEKEGKNYLETIISTINECLNNLSASKLTIINFRLNPLRKANINIHAIAVNNTATSSNTISTEAYCLQDVKNILIPDFQRAYAQGRNTPQSREIIENFITDIRKALICSDSHLSLDFIYGRKNNGVFEPYDGQQRLTTLFLVHLYILRKADCEQNRNQAWRGFKLSYRTSIEAGRFVEAISENKNQIFFKQNGTWKLCHLESQLYVDSQMLEDDAVKNMLRTLSVIDEKLGNLNATKASESLAKISFSLYDRLPDANPEAFYLTTNTRGLPLTPFENFRSKYDSYLKVRYNKSKAESLSVTRKRMNKYFNYFYSPDDKKSPDEKLMNLFVSYFSSLYALYNLKEDEIEKNKKFVPFQYFANVFDIQNMEVETIMLPLLNLLDFLTDVENKERNLNILTVHNNEEKEAPWFSEKIRNAIINSNNENSAYLLLVTFFFKTFNKTSFDGEKYRAYIRVVTNLINNDVTIGGNRSLYLNIRNSDLSEHELLKILSTHKIKNEDSKAAKTIEEEIKKLELIQADSAWRSLIEDAESTAFADGFIGYLFDDNDNKKLFDFRLKKFSEYFDENGVKEEKVVIAYIELSSDDQNTKYFDTSRDHWRNIIFSKIRDKEKAAIYRPIITKLLTTDLDQIDYISGDKDTRSYKIRESLIQNKWFIKWMISQNNDFSLFWVGDSNNPTPVFSKPYSHTNICWDAGGWSYDALVIQKKQITAFFQIMGEGIQPGDGRFYIIDECGNDITNSATYKENKNHLVISAYYRNNGWIDFKYRDRNLYLLYQGVIVTQEEYTTGIIDWSTASERSIYENQNDNYFAGNLKNKNDIISILNRLVDEN